MGLDTVELVMDVEEVFEISFSDKEASEIETVGEFYETILSKLPNGETRKKEVWEQLRKIIGKYISKKDFEKITPEARIVKDLGIN